MRLGGVLLAACLASSASAIEFTFQKEGYYCESDKDLNAFISSYVVQGNRIVPAGCGVIQEGGKAKLLIITVDNDKLLGQALIDGRQPATPVVFFTVATTRLALVDADSIGRVLTPSTPVAVRPSEKPVGEPQKEFKTISPRDVRNTPDKWVGRDIRFTNVNVYWVDDEDIRILTGSNLTLFSVRALRGDPRTVEQFKRNCETEREATSPKCRTNVRFSYIRHSEDSPGGLFKRTVLITNDAEIEVSPPRRRR